jgi:serine O-acetyltransferase
MVSDIKLLSYKITDTFNIVHEINDNRFKHIMKTIIQTLLSFMVVVSRNDIKCKIPKSTIFGHGGIGVVMNCRVKLGGHCIIGQNVTLGERNGGYPSIGWGVIICAHTIIIGGVRIGSCSVIGAGSVVIHDIPPWSVVVGNPGRVIKTIKSKREYWKYRNQR